MSKSQDKMDRLETGKDYAVNLFEGYGYQELRRCTVLETHLPLTGQVSDFGVKVKFSSPDPDEDGVRVIHVKWIGMEWDKAVEIARENTEEATRNRVLSEIETYGFDRFFDRRNGAAFPKNQFFDKPSRDDITAPEGFIARPGNDDPRLTPVWRDTDTPEDIDKGNYFATIEYTEGLRIQRTSKSGKTVYETFDVYGTFEARYRIATKENFNHLINRFFVIVGFDDDGVPICKAINPYATYRIVRKEIDREAMIEKEIAKAIKMDLGDVENGRVILRELV